MGDWDAWEPQEPPRGFAERVVAEARREEGDGAGGERRREERARLRTRSRRAGIAFVALFAAAAAALFLFTPSRPRAASGAAIVAERTQVAIGARAVAVLEPGAEVKWSGDDGASDAPMVVTQARGNVFYRVEPGAAFRVHTGAGDVEVKWTCFRVKVREDEMKRDVKAGAVGAVIGAAVFVGVYEGKVALSRANGNIDVPAGQTARADASGVKPTGDLANGERLFDGAAADQKDDPLVAANASLADSVRLYKTRLEEIEAEKKKLQQELTVAQQKLAAEDGGTFTPKSEFDLTQDDWKDLAKKGQVRARLPCKGPNGWVYSAKNLDKLGLPPQDGPIIGKAMEASAKRTWSILRPMCAELIGGADIADRVGPQTCQALVLDMTQQKDGPAADEAMRQVAEIRAGERPMPSDAAMTPLLRLLLALTGETKQIEADLAQSLGPDEAHRIVYAEVGCWSNSGWGVGPRPSP